MKEKWSLREILKTNLFMKHVLVLLLILLIRNLGYGQDIQQNKSCCINKINKVDSLGRKIGLWIEYDIEKIKLSETKYSYPNCVDYTKYFSRDGVEINTYTWKFDIAKISKLKELIRDRFILNDISHGNGSAILVLIIDPKVNLFEIRLCRGITDGFNTELLRVIRDLENSYMFFLSNECGEVIVSHFAFRIFE